MSSFIIEVSVGGHSRGEAVVGAVGPVVGVDGAGRIDFHPTAATAMAVFAERDGVLYAMSANERQPAWVDRARLPGVWAPLTRAARLQVGLAMVTVRTAAARGSVAGRTSDDEPTLISAPAGVPVVTPANAVQVTKVEAVRSTTVDALRATTVDAMRATAVDAMRTTTIDSNPALVWSRSGSHPPAVMPLATSGVSPIDA